MSTVYDVAVVGSRGFLGSAAVAALEASGASVATFGKGEPYDGRARTVVWAAGHVTPADTSLADEALADLQALVGMASTEHVVLLSSGGAVYGPPASAPFREDHPAHPANDYGRIKLAQEHMLGESGLGHTVLRISNPYGPTQVTAALATTAHHPRRGQGVIGHWLAAIHDGSPVTLYGDGSTVRDFLYIDDLGEAVAAAALGRPGGVINIGSGEATSLAGLLELVHHAVALHPVEVIREPARGIDPPANWLDVSRAREVLGWQPRVGLAEGLARTWAAVRA